MFPFSQTGCHTKAKEPSLTYYLPVARGRIAGFIAFPRILVQCEMQSRRRFEFVSPCLFPTITKYKLSLISIIIIIKSWGLHGLPWLSRAIRPYRQSLLAGSLELIYRSPCWLGNTSASICWSSLENITYVFVLTSPSVSSMFCSSWMACEIGIKWK